MNKLKLFYVEDEPALAKIVKEFLESRDFDVRLITTGYGAIEEFKTYSPDVCILDVMLPFLDGFSIATEIRKLNPDQAILFLTAKNQTEDVLKGFATGGNDYIRKPFSMEELIVRIKNLIALYRMPTQQINSLEAYQIGKYNFYPISQELLIMGEVKRLSYRETQLLLLLSRSINQPIQRKLILDEIWGNDSFFNSRNLDVYINKLRDYLRNDEKVKILTLKGVGYRLVC
jgi:DNA-binding response OmpR family regulator